MDGTVSFFDPPVMFNRADVDRVLAQAQQQAALLAGLEREMARSTEYLTKVRIIVASYRLWGVGSSMKYLLSYRSSFVFFTTVLMYHV